MMKMNVCLVAAAAAGFVCAGAVNAQQVWTGYDYEFTKEAFGDVHDEANQDRITDNVWITRGNSMGIFNIAQEDGYNDGVSPTDTRWAYGNAVDWPDLEFHSWVDWHGRNPPNMIDRDAVVHLISDDIYIDIRFTDWGGGGAGGAFTYVRAVPAPSAGALLGLACLATTRRRR